MSRTEGLHFLPQGPAGRDSVHDDREGNVDRSVNSPAINETKGAISLTRPVAPWPRVSLSGETARQPLPILRGG